MKKTISLILSFVMLFGAIAAIPAAAANDTERVITAALTIIGYNEGSYTSVNANDNGALSIGKLQWHAGRALSLMRTIVNTLGATSAKSYIGESLYNEVVSSSTSWSTRKLNSDEKSKFSSILGTTASKNAQDALARNDVGAYVNHGIARGITSDMALVYYADIENQYGAGSQAANNGAWAIVNKVKNYLGKSTIDTLDEFHNAVLQVVSNYLTRRTRTYNSVKKLGWSEDVTPVEPASTNPNDYTVPTRDLYYNSSALMTGDDVKWVQAVLTKLGFTLDIDGQFGPATNNQVKAFQTACGLSSTGVVDAQTRAELQSRWALIDPSAPPPTGHALTVNVASTASFAGTTVDFTGAKNFDSSKGTADGCGYTNISPNPQKAYRFTIDCYIKNLVETDPYRNSDQGVIILMLGSGKTMGYNFATGKYFISGGGGGWSGDPTDYIVQTDGVLAAGDYCRFEFVVEANKLTLIANGATVASATVAGAFSADQYMIFYPKHVNMDVTYTKFENLDGSGTAVVGSGASAFNGFVGMNQAGTPYNTIADTYSVTFNGIADNTQINNCIAAINAIGTVTINSGDAITNAENLYAALTAAQKQQVTNYSTLTAARATYNALVASQTKVNNVIAAINAIGTVTINSGTAITNAENLYAALTSSEKSQVTNYNKLTAARSTYNALVASQTKVNNCIAAINAIGTVTINSGTAITNAENLYAALTSSEKSQVTNYTTLTAARAAYNALVAANDPNSPKLIVSDASAQPGDAIELTVLLENNPGITTLVVTSLEYDRSVLTLSGVSNGELFSSFTKGTRYLFDDYPNVCDDGVLMTLTFTVAANAPSGSYTVKAIANDVSDEDLNDVILTPVAGTVTVAAHVHSYGAWAVTTPATCTASGVESRSCACGQTETRTIAATGHSYGAWTVTTPATCAAAGVESRVCSHDASHVETRTIAATGVHNYVNGVCSVCGAHDPNYVDPDDPNAAKLTVSDVTAAPGDRITVTVSLDNNPGLAGLVISLQYDASLLTFVSVTDGELFSGFTKAENRLKYLFDDDYNVTDDGVLLTLVFDVCADADDGAYSFGVRINEATDFDLEDVPVAVVPGTITVSSSAVAYGDANGDGEVNMKDLVLIRRYVAFYDDETGLSVVSVEAGADVNGDGAVNMKDIVMLRRYLADYDESTGTSSVVLGPKS